MKDYAGGRISNTECMLMFLLATIYSNYLLLATEIDLLLNLSGLQWNICDGYGMSAWYADFSWTLFSLLSGQKPIKQSFCASLRRDAHWKCLILTILIYGCLGAIAWCRVAIVTTVTVSYFGQRLTDTTVTKSSPCEDGYVYIPVAFVIMLYLVYLVECWHCHTRIELKHKVDVHTVYEKIAQMVDAIPIIWWKALCYHYVRKTRHVTRYRNGDSFTSTQVYYERVNSHTAGSAFNFSQCGVKDVSASLSGLEEYPATKIKFSKGYSFTSTDAEFEFDEQRNRFYRENERRDDYMETREGMDLLNVNFREYMIAFADPDNLPWYVSHVIFWIASFLLLSWVLRVIIEFKTAYVHFHVHKMFGTNYVDTGQRSGQMTRANTMGSTELDLIIQNNYIVPSYSEALLMSSQRNFENSDANGNLTSSLYGATRSVTFTSLSSVEKDKEALQRFSSGSIIPSIPRCNSYSIINGGVVIQNNMQTTYNYANSPRRKQRRMFIFSRRNINDELPLTSPTEPQVYLNHRTNVAQMIRSNQTSPRLNMNSSRVSNTRPSSSQCSRSLPNSNNATERNESPPGYQEALSMQAPIWSDSGCLPSSEMRIIIQTERDRLCPQENGRPYHTIMETSL